MTIHKPVLLSETITLLNLKEGDTVVDATLGGGGHATEILAKIGEKGKLVAFDLDNKAIEKFKFLISNFEFLNNFPASPAGGQNSKFKIQNSGNIYLVQENFKELGNILKEIGIDKVDAILADLGWSSDQIIGKGMSFQNEEELDMRLDKKQELSAKKIVNEYSQADLENIIKNYGEEKFFRNIVKRIVEYRKDKKIETTAELAEIIKNAVPAKARFGKISPATKTFQALRIETNAELENLKKFLPQAVASLKPGGRLAVIAFHSLEDRIVKIFFRENARGSISTDEITGQKIIKSAPTVNLATKKPIIPQICEAKENPRSRSAKLRVCEKLLDREK